MFQHTYHPGIKPSAYHEASAASKQSHPHLLQDQNHLIITWPLHTWYSTTLRAHLMLTVACL